MSNSHYIRIGLFSKMGQITIRTLRHYDDLGLLKPAHIDADTSYRYYTFDQLAKLNQIMVLKDSGFSLEQISTMIHQEMTIEEMKQMMQAKKEELSIHIQEYTEQVCKIEIRLNQLERMGEKSVYAIALKQVPSFHVVAVRDIIPKPQDMPVYRRNMFNKIENWLAKSECEDSVVQEYVFYHMTEFTEEDFDIEAAVSITKGEHLASLIGENKGNNSVVFHQIPEESLVASLIHQGAMMDIGQALQALFTWVGKNGYSITGPVRELHWFGRENQLRSYNDVRIELQVPLSRSF